MTLSKTTVKMSGQLSHQNDYIYVSHMHLHFTPNKFSASVFSKSEMLRPSYFSPLLLFHKGFRELGVASEEVGHKPSKGQETVSPSHHSPPVKTTSKHNFLNPDVQHKLSPKTGWSCCPHTRSNPGMADKKPAAFQSKSFYEASKCSSSTV